MLRCSACGVTEFENISLIVGQLDDVMVSGEFSTHGLKFMRPMGCRHSKAKCMHLEGGGVIVVVFCFIAYIHIHTLKFFHSDSVLDLA